MDTTFETIIITKPDVNSKYAFSCAKDIINSHGEVEFADDWGVKKLAYPIEHFGKGHYYQILFKVKGKQKREKLIDELGKYYNEDEMIIKHIIIKRDN